MYQTNPDVTRNVEILVRENQRLKRRISALEAQNRLMSAGRSARFPVEFRSQFGEDALLWELFGGRLDGYFIEVGAFDGYDCSVSYAFEAMGWNGLLIEAIPERFEECRKRRPHSRIVHSALSCRGARGTATFTVTEDQFGGMLSYLDPASDHARAVSAKSRRTVEVPLTTMNDVLGDHQGEIDFAVIDVEGSELLLLDGFDLEKYRPKVLLIEDNSRGKDPDLTSHMTRLPYTLMGILEVNRIYVRNDLEGEMKQRMKGG